MRQGMAMATQPFISGLEKQFRDPDPEQRSIAATFLQDEPGPLISELLICHKAACRTSLQPQA